MLFNVEFSSHIWATVIKSYWPENWYQEICFCYSKLTQLYSNKHTYLQLTHVLHQMFTHKFIHLITLRWLLFHYTALLKPRYYPRPLVAGFCLPTGEIVLPHTGNFLEDVLNNSKMLTLLSILTARILNVFWESDVSIFRTMPMWRRLKMSALFGKPYDSCSIGINRMQTMHQTRRYISPTVKTYPSR